MFRFVLLCPLCFGFVLFLAFELYFLYISYISCPCLFMKRVHAFWYAGKLVLNTLPSIVIEAAVMPWLGSWSSEPSNRKSFAMNKAYFLEWQVQTVSTHWWIQCDWHIVVTRWCIFLLLAHWNVRVNSSGVNCSLLWGAACHAYCINPIRGSMCPSNAWQRLLWLLFENIAMPSLQ